MSRFLSIQEYECSIVERLADSFQGRAKIEAVRSMQPDEYTVIADHPVILVMLQEENLSPMAAAETFPRELVWVALIGVRSLKADGAHLGTYGVLDDVKKALVGRRILSASPERSVVAMISPRSSTFLREINGVFWYGFTFSFTDVWHRTAP